MNTTTILVAVEIATTIVGTVPSVVQFVGTLTMW